MRDEQSGSTGNDVHNLVANETSDGTQDAIPSQPHSGMYNWANHEVIAI